MYHGGNTTLLPSVSKDFKPTVTADINDDITRDISNEEIHAAICHIGADKAQARKG